VDGHLIIDQWKLQSATTYCAGKALSTGTHVVQMAYFDNTGDAVAKLWWTPGGGPPPPPTPPAAGWTGNYFNNRDLSGSPTLTRTDADLRFDWGNGSPASGLSADNFSARWTRDIYFPAGTYNFFAKHDDGLRLWVDNALVIDYWHDQPAQTHSGTRALSAGTHRVKVEYYEHTGFASVVVWWDVDGIEPPPGPGTSVTVDNTDSGFLWGGPYKTRHTAHLGVGGSLYWTYNSQFSPINYGRWTPHLSGAGNYEVLVYIPRDYATSAQVRYRILHNGGRHDRIVNQAMYSDQWVSLGTYYFNAANVGREFVLVYDNTREYYASRSIAFDAVKFVPR